MSKRKVAECVHCHRVKRVHGRGLCARCYDNPEIKDRYPSKPYEPYAGLTDADLERQVAERAATLPAGVRDMDARKKNEPIRSAIRVIRGSTKRNQR